MTLPFTQGLCKELLELVNEEKKSPSACSLKNLARD